MAIAIEFVNVIARKSAIEQKYPGGLDDFAQLYLPNHLEDEHLVRIGFMSTQAAFNLAEQLESAGLHCSSDGDSDVAVITNDGEVTQPWLSVGECDGRWACWWNGASPGKCIDFDPRMILRLADSVFPTVANVIRGLRLGGADVRERIRNTGDSEDTLLDCAQDGAMVEVEVVMDPESGRPGAVWGRRYLARRTSIAIDQALIRNLTTAIMSAGAEV